MVFFLFLRQELAPKLEDLLLALFILRLHDLVLQQLVLELLHPFLLAGQRRLLSGFLVRQSLNLLLKGKNRLLKLSRVRRGILSRAGGPAYLVMHGLRFQEFVGESQVADLLLQIVELQPELLVLDFQYSALTDGLAACRPALVIVLLMGFENAMNN